MTDYICKLCGRLVHTEEHEDSEEAVQEHIVDEHNVTVRQIRWLYRLE